MTIEAVLAAAALAAAAPTTTPRPTEPFRQEHVEVKEHLDHVAAWAGAIAAQPPAERKKTAAKIVAFFETHLAPHAAWEEKALYPLVDKKAGGGAYPFTASMRFEHTVVHEWTAELAAHARRPEIDAVAFARAVDRLLGLVLAHFDAEEEVLLPILDRTATKQELDELFHGHR